MYPERLEFEKQINWYGESFLKPNQLTRCYIHEDYTLKMHYHDFYEINIIMIGQGRHYISESSLAASAGDIFVIPPGIPHGYFPENRLDIAHIILKNGFTERYREELRQIPGYDLLFDIEPMIRPNSDKKYNLNMGPEGLEKTAAAIHKIIKAETSGLFMYENIRVLSLISDICERFRKNMSNIAVRGDISGEVFKIMQYIKQNCGSPLRISDIAEYGNMSAATLNRRFRLFLNMSPMEYVTECRVKKAEELTARGNMNKAEIANACGFYDSSHMNKYISPKKH